ncbi:type II secretion system protein [Methylocystis sp. JAN1]|uniref:type II secretion system protein n=1 Tax=Methylocystis sp. JAN1 TaxID=3397211 RepID=UPI003FA3248A
MRARLKSRKGFSLIESLAAFAILAMTLAQLLNGVSGGARNESRADFLFRAARQGAAHLEALGVDGPPPFGETSGRYPDGLYWFLSVTPGRAVANAMSQMPVATSFHARLEIKKPSGYGESFTLSAVKIRAVEPQQPFGQ